MLGKLRVSELFDVIVDWPASSGAVEDLRRFTNNSCSNDRDVNLQDLDCRSTGMQQSLEQVNRKDIRRIQPNLLQRLLHPGASTVEILQVYISIIRAFHILDPK
jgi:anaphase-promoting complex subunit 2